MNWHHLRPPSTGTAPTSADLHTTRLGASYCMLADQITFEGVAILPPGEATKQSPTPPKSILHTLNHNYVVNLIRQAHLEGPDHGFDAPPLRLHEGFTELWGAQPITRWYAHLLKESMCFRFIDGKRGADPPLPRQSNCFRLRSSTQTIGERP